MNYTRVAASNDLALNQLKAVQVGGKDLVLVRTPEGVSALDRKCTHMGADLCKGKVEAGQLVCPKHGARFDARSGEPVGKAKVLFLKMAVKALGSYAVKEQDGDIHVAV